MRSISYVLIGVALWLFPLSTLQAATLSRSSAVELEGSGLNRPDGSSILAYLDRHGRSGKQGILVLAQGSGCGSVVSNANVKAAEAVLPDFAVLTVEDYGVERGDADKMSSDRCRPAYYAHHTISQRVLDDEQVMNVVEAEPWWNGELVLFGGSEGGAVVQELAPRVPASAVVVFSSATGTRFRDSFVRVLPPPLAAQAGAALDDVEAHPDSVQLYLGNSHRWWSDIMDRRLSDDLLRAREPILVVQGGRDRANPAVSARAVRDAFRAAHRCNLTYLEYRDYDHHMVDDQGNDHFPEVLVAIRNWLDARLAMPKDACVEAPS